MKTRDHKYVQLIAVAGLVVGAQTAHAADEGSEPVALGEIVVTAQKREEKLQDIPVAINVVNEEQLINAGVRQFEDLTKLAPSLSVTGATGNLHSTIAMRGIFTNALSPGVPTGVGIVVDDVAQPTEARGFGELADVERIEVLRGPQSTISGRNAAAGLINIVTKAPSDVFKASAEAQVTTDQEYRLKGYITGPLASALSGSLTAYWSDWDGLIKNIVNNDKLGRSAWGVRPKLRFSPSEAFDATLIYYHQQLDEHSGIPVFVGFQPGANFGGLSPTASIGPLTFDLNNDKVASIVPGVGQKSKSDGATLRMDFKAGEHDILSITGWQKEHVDAVQDIYGAAVPRVSIPSNKQVSTVDSKTLSQELRLVSPSTGMLTYVGGLYYLDTEVTYDFVRNAAPAFAFLNFNRVRTPTSKNYAAYLRGTAHVTDAFDITAGLRYNREDISYKLFDRVAAVAQSGSDSNSVVLGDLSLQYKFTPDVMAYVRYAKGHQGRVYDLDAALNPTVPYTPVNAEVVDSFELGVKSQFFDRRLTLNVAVYDAVYKDYQAQRGLVTPTSLTFQLLNVGEVETKGLEFEGNALVTNNLKVDFSAAYTDAKINSWSAAPCYRGQLAAQGCVNSIQNLSNQPLSGTPKWRGNLGVQYRFPVNVESLDMSVRGDVTTQTGLNYDITRNPLTVQGGYSIVNLSGILASKDGKYQVTLFVNNLFDKQYVHDLSDSGGFWGAGALTTRDLPRDFYRYGGVRFSANF